MRGKRINFFETRNKNNKIANNYGNHFQKYTRSLPSDIYLLIKINAMLFDEISFHDAAIMEVTEDAFNQTLYFVLDMPIDWENNVFEKKLLRFTNAIFYLRKEIPFLGNPAILEINKDSPDKHIYNLAPGIVKSANYKIEINTNAGIRIIEFDDAELLPA